MSHPKPARFGALRSVLATGASALAFFGVLGAPAALAQDAAEEADEEDTVVVTGVRRALQNAQQLKRNADTVVDSITATDIGSFPDRSVAEALQRVPGITVSRFAASSDTTHFSAEPSTVIVRGLQQVRSEFNGRDSFNANSSRGLSFGDVSPELMAGVDTYKNQTADMIEGGIAGTINLRTRVPFDSAGQSFALSADAFYGDLSDEWTPSISGIWSDRWDTDAGEFGLMANVAYSRVITASEGVQVWRYFQVDGVYSPGTNWFPGGVDIRRNIYDRERTGAAFAAQWESPDDTLLATLQYNRSTYSNDFEEHSLSAITGNSQQAQDVVLTSAVGTPPTGTDPYEFDSRGVFTRGVIADAAGNWAGDPFDPGFVHNPGAGGGAAWFCYSWSAPNCPSTRGIGLSADTRYSDSDNNVQDLSLNVRWTPTDRLAFNFDVQYVDSDVSNFDNSTDAKTFAEVYLDMRGERPYFEFRPSAGFPLAPGGFTNPHNYFSEWTMEHIEESAGTELAVRADAEYSIDSGWIESLRIGVRHAAREQEINYSAYNWGSVTPLWGGRPAGVGFFLDQAPWNGQTVEVHNLGGDVLGGGVFGGGDFLHPRMSIVSNYANTIATYDNRSNTWIPLGERPCIVDPGSLYCPVEQQEVNEDTSAAYLRLDFGGPDAMIGGIEIQGNIGVRYVQTEVAALGGVQFPLFTPPADCTQPPAPATIPAECFITPGDAAFANSANDQYTDGATHENWLPSFNVRLGIADDMYIRFAASRAMARPDMGLYKNYVGIGMSTPDCTNTTYAPPCAPGQVDPTITQQAVSYTPTYTADVGNPRLAPTTADQIDLTYEWYFSDVGSFSAAVFWKRFYDYIQYGSFTREFTNNGVTRTATLRGPINGEGAELQGIELAYQTFFDFLPEPWDGFGLQANVTYVQNQGITNANLASTSNNGSTQQDPLITFTDFPLEGMSEWAANLVGMYERGPLAVRLAYNWRSEYLVSQSDCCIKLPIWQDEYGQLDGSIRYRLTDRLEMSFQGQNLLNSETVLMQQVTDDGMLLPRSWFINDRRFQIGLRYKM